MFGGLRILLDTSTPFSKVKEFLPLDGRSFDASEDHRYFEAMDLEGQQILSEGFPVRSFTITWEPGMPRLKLDFQSRILSQEIIFLHTWSFFALRNPSTTLHTKLHCLQDHCIRQADQEQKIWSSIRFSSFAHENFVLEKKAGTANMSREY